MQIDKTDIGKMETQLKQWGAKLDGIVVNVDKAGDDISKEYRKQIDDLKTKQQTVQSKLEKLKTSGGEKWETLKTGFESAWSELEGALKKLKKDPK